MSRLKALPLAVLLSLIAVQYVSSASITPQATEGKAAGPSRANLADSKTGEQQYPEEPYHGLQEVPDLIVNNPAYDIRQPAPPKRPYGKRQDEEPHSSYDRQGPADEHKHGDADDDGPHQHEHEHPERPHEGPGDKPYEGPKEPFEESPCPKAMTADAVEDVLINKASFVWKDLAEATSTRRGQNTRRAARKHSTDAETQDAQESATTDSAAATDSIADSPGAGTVGTASTTGGTVEYRAALRAAAAAGMPSSTASRIRMANPDNAATLGANEATVQVAAAAPAAATSADAAAGATAATPAGDAEKAKAAYDKNEPGLADPEFLLPVGPEVSGKGEFGTYDGQMVPTGEALAVGPHVGPQANPTVATILHAVNAVAEIVFMSKKAGKMIARAHETQIKLSEIAKLVRPEVENTLFMGDPSAFYDLKDERWVLTWTSYPDLDANPETPVTASLFVAVSHTVDPLEHWTVYAFAARPMIAPGFRFCDAGGKSFSPLAPQTSYSHDGFFVSIGASCAAASESATPGIMSTLFAFSKARLYDVDSTSDEVYAATYMGAMSWKSSISYKEQSLIREDYRTFNNLITPARPQEPEDVSKPALFVMKVDGAYMSVATLTDEPLGAMDCTENAPKIRAIIIGKGEDFSNIEGMVDGTPIMPQPGTDIVLDSGDTGMLGGKFGIRTYGTVQNKGSLYTTMSEYFGIESIRVPSIYWAIVATHPGSGLCKAARKKWGFIASQDGLALAYPVIAARADGSAIVVYSYSGETEELPHSLGPAYPGVASSVVGRKEGYGYDQAPSIDIIKLGPAAITQIDADEQGNPITTDCTAHDCTARWGDYSASQVYGDHVWFAVPVAKELSATEDYRQAWRSWISVEGLDDRAY